MSEPRTTSVDLSALLPGPFLCAECAARLCTEALRLTGVLEASCDEASTLLTLSYDQTLLKPADLDSAMERLAAEVTGGVEHATYRITGLD